MLRIFNFIRSGAVQVKNYIHLNCIFTFGHPCLLATEMVVIMDIKNETTRHFSYFVLLQYLNI